ncbi:MAG: enoyl-CoA hydratase/isomerase family protein [Planctomycetota bacterium]
MTIILQNSRIEDIEVATLIIDHPALNILDLEHCEELCSCLQEVHADDRARLVVLRGGGRCFSAGVDITQHTPELMPTLLPKFHEVFEHLLRLRAVTIAAVHGHCLGGAAELALACDRVLSESTARIGLPEIALGCFPPVAIPFLAARIGQGRAIEMMIGGRATALDELAKLGLVHRIGAAGQLDQLLSEEYSMYAGKSPALLGIIAGLMHEEARRLWATRIPAVEKEYLERLLPHPDVVEGISAFLAKRSPKWQDPDERPDPLEVLR